MKILIIYHHKTGCVLSKQLIRFYEQVLPNKINNNYYPGRKIKYKDDTVEFVPIDDFDSKAKYEFCYIPSPYYMFPIQEKMSHFDKVIHFIRDPYEQAISNFNYHLKDPSPEEWFYSVSINPTKWFPHYKTLLYIFNELDLDIKIIQRAKNYVEKHFKPDTSLNYYENLKSFKSRALLIETIRFIFDTKDILRMACIVKYNKECMNVRMSDFEDESIDNTIKNLSNYIFEEKIHHKEIIDKYKKNVKCRIEKGNHISNMKENIKEKQLQQLKNNNIISTIFEKIKSILE